MLDEAKLRSFRQRLNDWANQHLWDFPWRRTNDPYAIFGSPQDVKIKE